MQRAPKVNCVSHASKGEEVADVEPLGPRHRFAKAKRKREKEKGPVQRKISREIQHHSRGCRNSTAEKCTTRTCITQPKKKKRNTTLPQAYNNEQETLPSMSPAHCENICGEGLNFLLQTTPCRRHPLNLDLPPAGGADSGVEACTQCSLSLPKHTTGLKTKN